MLQDTPQLGARPDLAEEGVWSRARLPLTIGLILVVSGSAFEAMAVATTMPATIADLGGLALYGWAFSAFTLANLVGVTVAGGAIDRRGPALPFVLGVLLFVLGLLVGGLAPAMPVLLIGRAAQGFGGGVVSSVAYAAIGRGYPESAKARMLALLSSAWVVPGLLGPAVAGLVADSVGWRWVFLGLVPLPLIAALLTWPALRRLDHDPSGAGAAGQQKANDVSARVVSAVQLAAGAGLLMAGLGATALWLAAALAVAGLALGLPALRRLLPRGTLQGRAGLPAAIAGMGLVNMAFFGVEAFVPLALTSGRGQATTLGGLALTAAALSWTTGAWMVDRYAARLGRRQLVTAGLVTLIAGVVGVAALASPAVPSWIIPLAWGVAGLGMGFAYSANALAVLELAPAGQEGFATSAMQLASMIGPALGAGIGGAIVAYASAGNAPPIMGIAAHDLLMIAVGALALLVARGLPGRPERAS